MDYNWFGDGFRKIIENNGSFFHFSPIIGYMGDGVAICFTKDLTTRSLTLVVFSWSWDLEQIFSRSSAQIYLTQSRRVKTDCISKILKRSCLQDVRLGCIVHRNVSIARTRRIGCSSAPMDISNHRCPSCLNTKKSSVTTHEKRRWIMQHHRWRLSLVKIVDF
jgi:hypothetical protein